MCVAGITAHAASAIVAPGQAVTFSANVSGTAPFSYQWYKDGATMAGATGATYQISAMQTSNVGSYSAVISNVAGSTTSDNATISLSSSPVITTQPISQTVTAGAAVTFTGAASGSPALTFQWKFNGISIAGATTSALSMANAQVANAGNYNLVVTNTSGSVTSNTATLTVNAVVIAPVITTQPLSQNVNSGSSVSFTVAASGIPAPTYQWRKDGVNLSGATNATYTVASVATGNAGTYSVVATNSVGAATSNGAVLTVNSPPAFTIQPLSQTVMAGSTVTFTVVVSGTPVPIIQWRMNGVNISGATNASYSITGVTSASAGTYSAVVTNSAGSATSSGAVLTVNTPVTVAAPGNLTALAGSGTITLAWSDNSTNEAGFEVQYSVDGTTFLTAGTVGANILGYTDPGLPDGRTYTYRVRAFLGTTVSGFSNSVSATTPAATVNWTQADVGSVGLAGSGSVGATTATLSASGADIWGGSDAFRFVYQSWSGDGVMITRVASLDNTDPWAKAGVMFRESLAANARNAFVCVTPGQGVNLQCRTTLGGMTDLARGPGSMAPYWLKLVRVGNTFTSYASSNGSTWTLAGTKTVPMSTNLYVGFAVTSHNNSVRTIAVFDYLPITAQ